MPLPRLVTTRILPAALGMLFGSLRIELEGDRPEGTGPEGVLFAFWHGKMAAGWLLARRLFPERARRAVVSLSEDGSILADALDRFGFALIRGSSSRGRDEVRSAMLEALRAGALVAITPDGPRGPAGRLKYGTVRIASTQGTPLLFASISYAASWRLKSWDRFEIPRPFTRAKVRLRRIPVPAFGSEAELRTWADTLSDCLTDE